MREKGNYKNGGPHGLYECFDENGQLESRGNYKTGKKHGLWEVFYLKTNYHILKLKAELSLWVPISKY